MNILVIDDDKVILKIINAWLVDLKYNVIITASGKQGLQIFSEEDIDVVICDVEMPEITGFQVVESIRQMNVRWVPIILMSSIGNDHYYKKGISAGADFYITKPLNEIVFDAFMKGVERMHNMRVDLEISNFELSSLMNNTRDGIITFNHQGIIIKSNKSGSEMLGYDAEQLIGMSISDIILYHQYDNDQCFIDTVLYQNNNINSIQEYCAKHKQGNEVIIEVSMTPVKLGDQSGVTAIVRDISERKKLEHELKFLAQFDPLTHLPNRTLFLDRLNLAISRSKRTKTIVALLFIDLDRFKYINDTMGHDWGDQLLVEVSKRLKDSIRSCDTVARFGGDEFIILLESLADNTNIPTVIDNVFSCFHSSYILNNKEFFITISIGVSTSTNTSNSSTTLIKEADLAMYKAKEEGRNRVYYFTESLNAINLYRMELLTALTRAMENEELSIYYQPQFNIEGTEIIGAEALLRWVNPKVGSVSPAEFVPLLEETGLILNVTEWVIKESMQQWKDWLTRKLLPSDCKLSVNLSVKHFTNHSPYQFIQASLKECGLSCSNFGVEITETVMMSDTKACQIVLEDLASLGVCISLDDFGTGYSSLSYLSQFPIDIIKIDHNFLSKASKYIQDKALLLAIINMAKSLNLKVTAEGVDTKEKMQFLQQNNCDYMQGFLFSKPLNAKGFEKFIDGGDFIKLAV